MFNICISIKLHLNTLIKMTEVIQQYFLQFMLKNSFVSLSDALKICNLHTDALDNLTAFKTFLYSINESISKHELKIVLLRCEITGDSKLALINTASDDITKLQMAFTQPEVQYFQVILKELLAADDHRLPIMYCLNLCSNVTSALRKDIAEKALDQWKNGGYLVDKDSYIHLGPRCIAEFAPYFHTHCKDFFSSCNLCSEPVFVGETCDSCSKTMHKHCIQKFLQKQSKCPSCKTIWKIQVTNSHNNADSSSADEEILPSQRTSKRRKTRGS